MTALLVGPLAGGAASLLAGALFPLALAPFGWWPLAIVSCALLNVLLQGLTPRQVFRRSLAYGLGMFGVGVSWVYISVHTHGGETIAISLLLTALLVWLLALCFAVPFSLFGLAADSPVKRALLFPAVWVLVEWIRGWIFTGFPWLYMGNAFIDTWLAGWAPIVGVLGLSLMGALSAALVTELLRGRRSHRPTLLSHALLAGGFWIAGAGLGSLQWTTPAADPLRLTMVQPALTPSQKWNSDILYQILVQLRELSAGRWEDSDLMIWPESAIPTTLEDVAPFTDYMAELARETDTTLITGIPMLEDGRYYNGVILLGDGEGTYRKRHLVPFGEYIPLGSVLRQVIGFFDRPMSSFSAGTDQQPLLVARGIPIATAICYEIVYQDLVAASAGDAQLILTLSNDVWFGDSIGPHQHLQMARLRARENGKPVVRDTNDGITAIIDADGDITHRLPQFTPGVLQGEVVPRIGSTPFNRWGSWPVVLLCLGLMALGLRVSRYTLHVSPQH